MDSKFNRVIRTGRGYRNRRYAIALAPPTSGKAGSGRSERRGLSLRIFLAGFSSIFTGFNFIITIHKMRAPGMRWGRLPIFIWSHYATSVIMVLATRVSLTRWGPRYCWG